jgi:hypothetical protein
MDLIVARRAGTLLSAFPDQCATSDSKHSCDVTRSPSVRPANSDSRGGANSAVGAIRRTRSSRNSRTPRRRRHHATRYQCSPLPASPSGSTTRVDTAPLRSKYSIASTDRLHNASSTARMTPAGLPAPARPSASAGDGSTGAGSTRQMRSAMARVAARSPGAITDISLCSADRAADANGVPAIAFSATAVAIASRGEMFSGGNVYARSSTYPPRRPASA